MTIARPVHSHPGGTVPVSSPPAPSTRRPPAGDPFRRPLLSINTQSILTFGVRFHVMTTGSASTDIIIGDRSFTFVEDWDASPLTRRGYIALSIQAESPVNRQRSS